MATCAPADAVGDLRERLGDDELCVVWNGDGIVLGLLRPSDLKGGAASRAEQVMDPAPSTFRADVPAEEMREYLAEHDMTAALVTTPEGKLLGLITLRRLERVLEVSGGGR